MLHYLLSISVQRDKGAVYRCRDISKLPLQVASQLHISMLEHEFDSCTTSHIDTAVDLKYHQFYHRHRGKVVVEDCDFGLSLSVCLSVYLPVSHMRISRPS